VQLALSYYMQVLILFIFYFMEKDIMNMLPKRQEGQGLVEYALILVLVAVVVIVILQLLGPSIVLTYARVMGGFNGQTITGNGNEGIAVTYSLQETDVGGGDCSGTFSDMVLVLTQNGRIVTNQSATVSVNGQSITVDVPSNGLIRHNGTINVTGSCPIKPNISW
jgi:pilus assembly protein Flp/PilA